MAKPNVISRDELLRSAAQCIADRGIQALTLKAVAEGANVTQGTVYYHFRNKEQLLMETIQKMCTSSWEELEERHPFWKAALDSAKSRCTPDSLYHRLFYSLVAASMHQDRLKDELGHLLEGENDSLAHHLRDMWKSDQYSGISVETWSVLLNALMDGLALQALLSPRFDAEQVYGDLARLVEKIAGQEGGE